MPSLLDLIAEREAAATTAADHLRDQIAKLSGELAAAETELAEPAITRKTVITLTGPAEATAPADATIASTASDHRAICCRSLPRCVVDMEGCPQKHISIRIFKTA